MAAARISPSFRKAKRYANTIPTKADKRRAVRHLCRKLRAAIAGR